MTTEQKLAMLKIDLGITSTAYDNRLTQYIEGAKREIEREGITLSLDDSQAGTSETIDDANLVVMYAAWMWRRRDTGEGMPRMIRWMLNNRIYDMEE